MLAEGIVSNEEMNARLTKQINDAVTQSLVDEHFNSKSKKSLKEEELKFEKQL